MLSDIEIARGAALLPIEAVAARLGIAGDDLLLYGKYKAKIMAEKYADRPKKAKLILVTAINPTPYGEGKTTVTVGLGDALASLNKHTAICLREPSLGPVFGVKGGATGGGYAQVLPMDDINLHFTGDMHAITATNNLLAAIVDNHIHQGNALGLDPRRVVWQRAIDMNDRHLRRMVGGLGGNGPVREDGFNITAASEIMAIFCLSETLAELKANISKIIVAYTFDGAPVTAHRLNAPGAMTALLRDAFYPNLVQTLAHTPAFIHGGPFANIAHGCNALAATNLALRTAQDYVITEAGFGADLGAEKFFNITCRKAGLTPSAVVLVATVRALKHHGTPPGKPSKLDNPGKTDLQKLADGMANLHRHIDNIRDGFGLPVVVALNKFHSDTPEELACLTDALTARNVPVALTEVFARGGAGGRDLAAKVIAAAHTPGAFRFTYTAETPLAKKINAVAQTIYKADPVTFAPDAAKTLRRLEKAGHGSLPVCIAKTPFSFSDDPKKLGAPSGFPLHIREVRLSAGAGFVVALCGDIMTLPALSKTPSAEKIDVSDDGIISGLA